MDTLDGPNPLNVIDWFPPGLFSHKTLLTTLDFSHWKNRNRCLKFVSLLVHFAQNLNFFCYIDAPDFTEAPEIKQLETEKIHLGTALDKENERLTSKDEEVSCFF